MACLQLWFVFPATFLPLVWLHRPGHRRTAQHGAPLSGRHSQKIFLLSKQVILGPNHKYCIAANFKRFPPCTPRWHCGTVGCVWCGGGDLVLQLLAIYIIVPLLLLLLLLAWWSPAKTGTGLHWNREPGAAEQERRGDGLLSRGEISWKLLKFFRNWIPFI